MCAQIEKMDFGDGLYIQKKKKGKKWKKKPSLGLSNEGRRKATAAASIGPEEEGRTERIVC